MELLFEEENVASHSRDYISQTMKSNQMDLEDVMPFIQYFIKIFKNRWKKITGQSHVTSVYESENSEDFENSHQLFESETPEDFETPESPEKLEEVESSEVVENLGAYRIVEAEKLKEVESSEVVENLGAYSIVKESTADLGVFFRIVKNCNGAESPKGH